MVHAVHLKVKFFSSMQKLFKKKKSFFSAVDWNNLDISIRNLSLCHIFKNLILKFIRPEPNRISSTQNIEAFKLLTRMTLGLSHLADHKFRHIFQDCLNPICDALHDLVPFVSIKKCEKHPWRSINFSIKISTPPWVFFTFFKLYIWYQIAQCITFLAMVRKSKQACNFLLQRPIPIVQEKHFLKKLISLILMFYSKTIYL